MSAAPVPYDEPFRRLWDLGYRRLVPIVPPNAELSPHSSLSKRPACRGKAVGELGPHGWKGFNWHQHVTTEDDLVRWARMGAGVGIRTGEGLVALDGDTLDPALAALASELAEEILGPAPRRIGRAPKFALLYRYAGVVPYQRVEFTGKAGARERVELLSEGRQLVAHGVHPVTLKPYAWPFEITPFDDLTVVTPEQIEAYFARLLAVMPEADKQQSSAGTIDRSLINQMALQGPLEHLRRTVAAIPNDRDDRERWVAVGIALKAALPNEPEDAFDIWWDFSTRWNPSKNYEAVLAEWNRMHGPFEIGAPYLYGLASKATGENQMPAERFFGVEEGSVDTSAWPEPKTPEPVAIQWVDPAAWVGRERVKRRWFVDGLIPDGVVTLLTGKGGIGKSLLVQQLMTCVALGLPALGRDTMQAKIMLVMCEDDEDELHGRQLDICNALACELSDLSDKLRIASRVYMDNLLAVWNGASAEMRRTALFDAILADALAFGAKIIVVDTIADTFGGNEIDRQQVRQYIQACAGKLAAAIGGAVVLLGHPSKSGEASGEGTSGSTAWHATVRSRLYLEESGKAGAGFRKLTSKKSNYGPVGDEWTLQWRRGFLEVVSSSEASKGVPETTSALHGVVLAAIRSANVDGVRLALGKTSKYRAEPILRTREPDAFAPFTQMEVDDAVQALFATGQLVEKQMGKDGSRNAWTTICPTETDVFG